MDIASIILVGYQLFTLTKGIEILVTISSQDLWTRLGMTLLFHTIGMGVQGFIDMNDLNLTPLKKTSKETLFFTTMYALWHALVSFSPSGLPQDLIVASRLSSLFYLSKTLSTHVVLIAASSKKDVATTTDETKPDPEDSDISDASTDFSENSDFEDKKDFIPEPESTS